MEWEERTDFSVKISSHWDANPNRTQTKSQTHYVPKRSVQRVGNNFKPNQLGEGIFERKTSNNYEVFKKRAPNAERDKIMHQNEDFSAVRHTVAEFFYTLRVSSIWRAAASAPGLQISSHSSEVLKFMRCGSMTDTQSSSWLTSARSVPRPQERKAFHSHNIALRWEEKKTIKC